MKELEVLLAEKIDARGKLNMEIFSIQESLKLLKSNKDAIRN